MRIVLALVTALGLLGCAHAPEAPKQAACPNSEMASQCTSGGLKCETDEKNKCQLCKCERMAF